MKKIRKSPIVLFMLALILLYVIIYIVPSVTGALVSSYIVEYGELKVADEVTGYLVRNEQVYTAGTTGTANRYIDNGTLVRKGTTVMEITGGADGEIDDKFSQIVDRLGDDAILTSDYAATKGGVISYYVDGYERRIRPNNMKNGGYSYYSKLSQDSVQNLQRDTVVRGEPVFKVVDRTKWYIVTFVPKDHGARYKTGQDVIVEFEDGTVDAEVHSVTADVDGEHTRVILACSNYYEKYMQMRACPVTLVTYEERGLLVENSSITKENGQLGVFVKKKTSGSDFVPIKVYATDGVRSLVADTFFDDAETGKRYDTVEIYDEVLKEPKN